MTAYNTKTEDDKGRQIKPALTNTAADGSGTFVFPIADTDGHKQVDVLSIAAGTNRIGQVAGTPFKVTASKTLIADGNYAQYDVLSEHKTAGTAFTFGGIARTNGGSVLIGRAEIIFSKAGGITAITTLTKLQLYNTVPTCNLNDNGPNTGVLAADVAKHEGDINFPALDGADGGSPRSNATPSSCSDLPMIAKCATADDALYGVLEFLQAETNETAGTIVTINLYGEQY